MPWTNPETFTAGQTLSSASMNIVSANARMGGPVYTNEAARDAAITSPEEGMVAYLTAPTVPAATGETTMVPTGVVTVYNGSVWVCVTPVSAVNTLTGTTTSATYTATLGGSPGTNVSVTLVTGTTALVSIHCGMTPTTVPATNYASLAVSGAGTVAASDNTSVFFAQGDINFLTAGAGTFPLSGLTAGTNTFTLQYRTGAGTASFFQRRITVQGIA
jgi:hypothetical protein